MTDGNAKPVESSSNNPGSFAAAKSSRLEMPMRHLPRAVRLLALAAAVGGALAPLWARGAGDPTPYSNAPMVLVLNPGRGGVVGSPFRLQVHAASPTAGGAIASVAYTTNGTAPSCAGTALLPVNTRHDGGAGGAVYEENVTLGAGSYTLRVCARNAAGTVEAPPVAVTVTAGSGDGNLLVRDNANQLCTDCHALQSHTSQSTSNKYGSWAIACRDCHVPHGTRNIYLLGERITPPDVHGANAGGARDVRFSTAVGDSGVAGLATPTQGSFTNADNTGPCQVCHTQTGGATARFRQSGNADTHFTGAATQNCATCHLHTKGFSGSCTTCHGDSARVGEQTSPPIDTCGNAGGGRVGAHQAHLSGGTLSSGVNCADCHLNPPVGVHPTWASCDSDPAHHAIMTWGALSRTVLPGDGGTVNPTWDPATQSCSNYCHGDFKNGNRTNVVAWNGTAACGSCHGQGAGSNPLPPAPHPQNSACGSCHSTGYTTTTVVAALHIDGRVDSANFSCHSCHGSAANNAPPIAATTGNANAIGAHQAHVAAGSATVTNGYACTVCHVDNGTTNMTHSNGTVDLAWAVPANQGTTPTWSATGSTCANYCHGTSAAQASWGGTGTTPGWLTVNGTYRACDACHGAPPPLNVATHHPFNTACGTCHGTGYAATSVTGAAALGTHVNGAVETSRTGCTRCHGDLAATGLANSDLRVAPGTNASAADTTGATAATSAAVGAHRAHLANATFRSAPIACAECHSLPADGDVNHATGGGTGGARATLSWGGLANNGSTFDVRVLAYGTSTTNANGNTSGNCSNTYCHAPRLADTAAGLNLNPSWTGAGTVACGSCHGLPPVTSQHPVGATNCGGCHPGYTSSSVNLTTHLDGSLQYTPTGCSACHGSSTRAPVASATALDSTGQNLVRASPPADSQGAQTSARVGAHAQHVNQEAAAPALSNALACTNCHATPAPATYTLSPLSHVNNAPAVPVFGGIATTGGVTPGYAAGSCSSTYCHGNFPMGNGANPIAWGTGTQGKLGCTACHGAPPPLAMHHPQSTACGDCHGAGYSLTTVNAATHVDGARNLNADRTGCVACHGTPGRTGVTGADTLVAAAPPAGSRGEVLASTRAVGAHEAHTNKAIGAVDAPRTCFECHGNYPADSTHADGTVAMVAGAGWNGTTLSCSNYCHGNTMPLGGGSNRTPSWSGGPTQGACGTCHGNPPQVAGSPHPNNPTCSTCHPAGYLQGSVAAAAFPEHIDNVLDFNGTRSGCTSCHGDPARGLNAALATVTPVETLDDVRAMPPIDTQGNSTQANNGVGAHLRHVNDRSKPLLCAECHGSVPAAGNTSHADSVTTITFLVSELASGLNPATNPGAIVPPTPLNPVYAEDVNGIGTCSSVYCHGDGLPVAARGNNTAPAWNATLDCNACHGEPPGDAFHRTAGNRTTCVTCHSQTTDATGLILTANGTHVNGFANLSINGVNGCAACHGTANRTVAGTLAQEIVVGAPPRALDGSTARTTAGVGAHEVHVNGGRSNSMTCSECHGDSVIYGQNGMFSHADGTVQMAWGAIATARGSAPGTFTPGSSTTCSSTYCHGNFPGGNGTGATTAWTTNTASPQLGCTACHGNPPALNAASHHPRNAACATCHGTGYSSTTVVQATHVNGLFTVSSSGCTLCHGDNTVSGVSAASALAAPGVNATAWDVTGAFTGTAAIGAHAAHLTSTRLRAAIPCSECHAPVTDTEATGWLHATGTGTGGARATIAFGALARTGGITTAAYAGSTTATVGGNGAGTCSNTYCHGNFPTYGNNAPISWTAPGPLGCTACHGAPPGGVHGAGDTNCGACHTGYSGSGSADWAVNATDHMNGVQNVNSASCTACHGDNGATPRTNFSTTAPPRDRSGSVLVSARGVGAHATHLRSDGRSAEVACGDCHAAPQGATGHNSTGNATVTLAGRAGAGATYSATNLNCSTTYCHGNFTYGAGAGATVAWNATAGLPLGCGSCHGNPPVHPHPGNTTCSSCHGTGYSTTTVARATHVDGLPTNLTAGCTACHGDRAVAGASLTVNTLAAAPGETGAATSADTGGGILSSSPGVGAHRAHLAGTRFRAAPIACNECHALPPSNTDTSHGNDAGTGGARARLTFGALAETDTFEPRTTAYAGSTSGTGGGTAGSCSASYCHAPRSTDTAATVNLAPNWTGSIACGSCHGIPPVTPNNHSTLTTCSTCHGPGYATTGITGAALASHMNGSLQVSINSCSGCHGSTAVAPVASASGASFIDSFGNNLVRAAPPPVASAGGVAGVHLQHVNQAATAPAFSSALACINCHDTAPAVTAYAGGHTNGALEVQWGSLASLNDTLTPAPYNDAANTCSSTYCHGNFPGGLNQQNLSWTTAGKLGCNTCHLSPPVPAAASGTTPASYHPGNTNCALCHPSGYTASAVVTASHVDGANTFNATQLGLAACQQCHGQRAAYAVNDATNSDPNVAAAPGGGANGPDSHGNTAITAVGVGAHQVHVNPTAVSKVKGPLHCAECHGTDRTDRTHASGSGAPAVSDWGTLANGTILGGASTNPSYATPTCSSTYCHGARFVARDTAEGRTGSARFQGSAPSPSFTTVLSGCGTCHGFPPDSVAGGSHEGVLSSAADCNRCHAETVSAAGAIVFTAGGLTTHIDGKRDGGVSNGRLACGGCHATLVAAMSNTTSGQMHHYVNNANAPASATAYSTTQPGATTDATRTCAMCHVDHDLFNASKGANLRSGLVAAPTATATDAATANGAGICVSCHTTAQTKSYANGAGATQTPAISGTNFAATPHNYGVQSSFGASSFTGNCVKCHSDTMAKDKQTSAIQFGLHDSSKSSMTDPMGSAATAVSLEENFCYRCHSATTDTSPGGGPAKVTADRDWYGTAGATMSAASQNVFARMPAAAASLNGATRLFFRDTNTNGTSQAASGSTDTFTGGTWQKRDMATAQGATAQTQAIAVTTTGNPAYWRGTSFVSPAATATTAIPAGAWTLRLFALESATSANAQLRVTLYVWTAAGARGTIITAPTNYGTELTTTSTAYTMALSGAAVTLATGDRVVCEVEIASLAATSTTGSATIRWNGTGTTDDSSLSLPGGGSGHAVAGYSGLHRPSPADEHLQRLAANKHVECADCHDPHEAQRPAANTAGAASAAGTTATLTDATRAWTAGQWVGAQVMIRSGARAWLRGTITANTATGLTFTPAMASATAAGDDYFISSRNGSGTATAVAATGLTDTGRTWVASQWVGYAVSIVSGTGAGQVRTISANTANAITVSANWTTTPAVGSRYAITRLPAEMTGATGVDVTAWGATSWSGPTTFTPAAGSTTALPVAVAQWQVCFKCHSSANTALATWDANWTNLALEFNPNNQSYHPVVAALPASDPGANGSSRLVASQLINGWQPGQTMICTDCHNTDAASPAAQGPHGSAVNYMLAGVNRAWPFTTAGASAGTAFTMNITATGYGTANGLFCRNCHPDPGATASGSTNTGHVQFNGQHRGNAIGACVRCHIRVPHGGRVSRLISTSPNAPARYQVTGHTLNFTRFVKSNTNAYSGSAWFGTTCSTHSGGGTGGETW